MKYMECDVLVVGSGGAALRAAIAAKELNPALTVMVLTKGQIGKSGVTAVSCSDRMAFHATLKTTEPGGEDAWKYHADDVYRIGGKVSDKTLADVLAKNAEEAFEYLDELGVPFVKKNGIPDQFVTDGSDYARACYTGPRTANHIEEALVRRFQSLPIKSVEYAMAAELISQNGRVTGVVAVDTRIKDIEEAFFAVHSPTVILATGGGGLIYENNVFPGGMTGDGYGMAYVAGAKLVNMEFIQIGIASTKTKFNCSGSMMRSVPRLVNSDGVEFLSNYFPAETSAAEIANIVFKKGASWPVSYEHKTHIIDIALYKEWKAGRKTYLDYSQNPTGFSFDMLTEENQARYSREMNLDLGLEKRNLSPLERLREINQPSIDWFAEYGIHLDKGDMIQVAACAQHFQGGVKIDKQGRTSVHGLWAVGETAGGQHGANRPGGNALLDCQVFGKLAGQDAAHTVGGKHALSAEAKADWAQQAHTMAMVIESQLGNAPKGALPATAFRRALQSALEGSAGIVRTSEGLRRGMNELKRLREQGMQIDEKGPAYYMENANMLTTAEMVLAAAMLRDESRGPHLRFAKFEDNTPIPRKEGAWEKYIVIHKGDIGMEIHVDSPEV